MNGREIFPRKDRDPYEPRFAQRQIKKAWRQKTKRALRLALQDWDRAKDVEVER